MCVNSSHLQRTAVQAVTTDPEYITFTTPMSWEMAVQGTSRSHQWFTLHIIHNVPVAEQCNCEQGPFKPFQVIVNGVGVGVGDRQAAQPWLFQEDKPLFIILKYGHLVPLISDMDIHQPLPDHHKSVQCLVCLTVVSKLMWYNELGIPSVPPCSHERTAEASN